ncbi:MAG: tetratricopeptide repeat protein [Firmicutes bacterium]|nr:tetratricopeptide repeat protein [Bacillota bacterium]
MARSILTRMTAAAKASPVILVVIALALSLGVQAAGIPSSDTPYGIQAGSDLEAGIDFFQSGRFEDAIRAFSRTIESEPEGPEVSEVYAWLGYAYLCRGWTSEAEKAYSESVSRTTDSALRLRALLALGQLHLDSGDYDKAVSTFLDALRSSGGKEKGVVKTLIGIADYEAGKTSAAKELFQEVLGEFPNDPVADYYVQVIEYAEKKKSVLFPTKPKLGRKEAAAKKTGQGAPDLRGVVLVDSGAKYTITPHVKLTVGTETDVPLEGFFLSAGDDSFRWHDWQSMNIEWILRGEEDGVKKINAVYYGEGFSKTAIADTSIVLDRRPPWGSFGINDGRKYTNNTLVALNLSFYDKLSGVAGICLSNDGMVWTGWMTYRSSVHNWQLPPGDGTKKIYARVHDGAGNISGVITSEIRLDTTPPLLWFVSLKHLSPTSVEITWMTDEDCDSVVEYRLDTDRRQTITIRDDKFTTHHVIRLEDLKPSTKYRFRALSRDLAGNLSVSQEYSFVTKAQNEK